MSAQAEWARREAIFRAIFEPGERLMRRELHGIMKLQDGGGWVDGAMAATDSGTRGNRKTGRLLWIPTTGSGASLKGRRSGLLSIPYESIRDHSVARGGWMPMVRELRLTVGDEELRFRGGRTFIEEEVAQLLPFVAPRRKA